MIFDDLFYPGNPQKRAQIAEIRAEITTRFDLYKQAWNKTADLLNNAFLQVHNSKYSGITILTLSKDIRNGTIGDCITEINTVLADTNTKISKLVSDIGLNDMLPADWAKNGLNLGDIGTQRVLDLGKKISTSVLGTMGGILTFFLCYGIKTIIQLGAMLGGAVASIAAVAGGVLLGMVIGVAAFVIVDIIASAITGAIERKELEEAVDGLKKIRVALIPPMDEAIGALNGISQSIKDGNYKLDDTHVLLKKPDGTYVIIDMGAYNGAVRSTSVDTGKEIIFLTA